MVKKTSDHETEKYDAGNIYAIFHQITNSKRYRFCGRSALLGCNYTGKAIVQKDTHTICMRFDLDTKVQDEPDVVEANDTKNVSPQHAAPQSLSKFNCWEIQSAIENSSNLKEVILYMPRCRLL